MPSLTKLEDVVTNSAHVELLHHLGYTKLKHISIFTPKELQLELQRVHNRLELTGEIPTIAQVRGWIKTAKKESEVSFETFEQECSIAPLSIPVDKKELSSADVDLEKIPTAQKATKESVYNVCSESNLPHHQDQDTALDDLLKSSNPTTPQLSEKHSNHDKYTALKDPKSLETFSIALITTAAILSIFAAIICTFLMLFDKENKWLLCGIGGFVIFSMLYLLFAYRKNCCICHQKQFRLKKRMVNKKHAHKLPLLGYLLSMCLHAIFLGWFKCMFCGSSIALYSKGPKKIK